MTNESPGAQAPSTAADAAAARYGLWLIDAAKALQHAADRVDPELAEQYRDRASKVFEVLGWLVGAMQEDRLAAKFGPLAAPSTGGAETAAGYVLVPLEPTEAMHAAAVRTIVRCSGNDDFPPRVWRAMLAARPAASSAPAQAVETATQEVERQIAAAVSRAGLMLLKKTDGYEVRKLGPIVAQVAAASPASKEDGSHE